LPANSGATSVSRRCADNAVCSAPCRDRTNVSAEQLTRGPGRISGRGGREDENRVGAVQPGEPDEPTEHQGDV
jgi:hypothetical protein